MSDTIQPSVLWLTYPPEQGWNDGCIMKFRLTYEGRLEANGTPDHKHEIRRYLHPQLKRLWEVQPNLKAWQVPRAPDSPFPPIGVANRVWAWQELSRSYDRLGYKFVPLANEVHSLHVGLEILFLRPGVPGDIVKSGDLDNRLKTLFDGLRLPDHKEELGRYQTPAPDEEPFLRSTARRQTS